MPIDQGSIVPIDIVLWFVKTGIVVLAGLYFIFSLIALRQVHFLTAILITETAPWIRAFSIVHSGFALGVIILLIGLLFF